MTPSSRCRGLISRVCSSRASSWASTTATRALRVKRSNNASSPPVVFLMHRLPAHTEGLGDGLPTPALLARVGDVDRLQAFLQSLQCTHRAQSDRRVGGARCVGGRPHSELPQVGKLTHGRQCNLTPQVLSTNLDKPWSRCRLSTTCSNAPTRT